MSRKGYDISEWLTPENKIRIKGWCQDGLIEKQIYTNMGISRTTFYKWKNGNDEFAALLKRNKEIADREVENALFKSATGFIGPDDKYYAPSTTAQIFWLKNRNPAMWRDQKNIEVSTPIADTAMKIEAILKNEGESSE